MKLSINIRNWGPYSTRDILLACAQAADESGLDTVWINERLTSSLDAPANMPQVVTPGRTLEPLAMLAFLAAATQRIGLGSGVINVPFRPALPTAKLVATIQELSGGRLRLGVGTGWMEVEFRALRRVGVAPRRGPTRWLFCTVALTTTSLNQTDKRSSSNHGPPVPRFTWAAPLRMPCVAPCVLAMAGSPPALSQET